MEANSLDYTGAIIMDDNLGYQEVYSSQNYGTFYSVFMCFETCSIGTSKGSEEITLNNVTFKIINYKGILNLGLQNLEFNPIDQDGYPEFKIEIRAMIKTRELPIKPTILNVTFPKDSKFLNISRKLIKKDDSNRIQFPNSEDVLVFDEEFYYRDGVDTAIPIENKPGSEDFTPDDNYKAKEKANNDKSWKRCYLAKNKIIIPKL